jgi:hypothetical protein
MYRVFFAMVLVAGAAVLATSGCKDGAKPAGTGDVLVLEYETIELLPGGEKHVKVKTGKAETVDAPVDKGITAKTDGGSVTVSAAKDAKEGMHTVTVKGGKAKDATIKVEVKKDAK